MLASLSLQALAELLGGSFRGPEPDPFTQVVTDSRDLQPGSLFVALKGPHFDGHDFIRQARLEGACLAIVERWVDDPLPQVCVASSLKALGQLATWNRQAFQQPVIAVTGNSGKTTVKEMLAAILAQAKGKVLATQGNLNNAIGVPLTLLQLEVQHQAAVVELGANHLHEIDYLASLTQPQLGIITNVTGAHLGEFGSLDAIAQAKGELIPWLTQKDYLVLNQDDHFYHLWRRQALAQVLTFGLAQGDVRAEDCQFDPQGCPSFTAVTPWGRQPVRLQLPGRHNLANALASIAAAGALGIPLDQQAQALGHLQPVKGRLQQITALGGAQLLDDSYNASPGAVKAAIDLLESLPGRRILALGSLAELGEASVQIHHELGRYAQAKGLDQLLVLAGPAEAAAEAFGAGAEVFANHEDLASFLQPKLTPATRVLVKGSRSARMERLVDLLRDQEH